MAPRFARQTAICALQAPTNGKFKFARYNMTCSPHECGKLGAKNSLSSPGEFALDSRGSPQAARNRYAGYCAPRAWLVASTQTGREQPCQTLAEFKPQARGSIG